MMNYNVIGCGAAGNKALAILIERGYNKERCLFVNSASKDIPAPYRDRALIFGGSNGVAGCGKERELGRKLILQDMKDGNINIDGYIDPDVDATIICGATEGGSGSASIPILAKYVQSVFRNKRNLHMPVIVVLFFGFNDDARGMQNSIEICQDLSDEDSDMPYGIIGICNSKFTGMNKLTAEHAANNQFVRIVDVLTGSMINESGQNIDDTDLYKLIATPGYMSVGIAELSKTKNQSQFDQAVQNVLDNTTLLETGTGLSRLGVIFNINPTYADGVDFSSTVLKKQFGIPYEYFTHIQDAKSAEWVSWIATGQKMPVDEVQNIYDQYQRASSMVDKSKDDFFNTVGSLRGNAEDGKFNLFASDEDQAIITDARLKKVKDDFFAQFGMNDKSAESKNKKSIVQKSDEY